MSAIGSQPETGLDRIRSQLDRFNRFELVRATNASLAGYLRALVAVEVLPSELGNQLTSLYYRSRFGTVENDDSQIGCAIEKLEAAQRSLESLDKQQRAKLAERWNLLMETDTESTIAQDTVALQKEQSPNERAKSLVPKLDSSQSYAALFEPDLDQFTAVPRPRRLFGRRPRFFVFIGLAVVVWTCVVLIAGYISHDELRTLVWKANVRFRLRMSVEESSASIRQLRSQIRTSSRSSETISRLKKLASIHEDRGEYAEAIYAYQQAVSRSSRDAFLLNNFAWLLLTAENNWYRDRVYALSLARRAFMIDQAPLITDTLAEAHFQNGNLSRAIRLEEEAIANETQQVRRSFYLKQLAKFKAAGGQSRSEDRRSERN